jgi:DNA topoisomerase II
MSKKIEDKYKVLDQISHILLRPQTYVGSNKPNTSVKNIIDDNKILQREITYIPSFVKIFDEVVTNSVDEHKRNKSLNKIDVVVDTLNNLITIKDNGGIPVVIHKEHGQYVPEVIFGNLMSGSNYDDSDERTVAGLNGLGAKLTNVFSIEFTISTCDGKNHFRQTFKNNMRDRNKPVVKKSKSSHTEIKYKPDLSQFGLDKIDNDHFKMLEKRVYDLAGTNPNIKFTFNGNLISFNSFEDYIKIYTTDYFYETKRDHEWSVGISLSENGFQQVSFANSIETYDGGTHVDYIMNQIIMEMRDYFQKKHKVDVKPSELKNHMFLFLNSTVINPSFSSQTKEKLITEVKEFGTKFEVSKKFIQSILKSEIVNSILDWIEKKKDAQESKLQRDLNKKLGSIKVDKLIDSKGKERWKHTIGLFEGDCLHEDTLIRVIREGDILDVKIKDAKIDDLVITHNNSFSNIYALTKKIKKKSSIKLKNGEELISSRTHRWFVYDFIKNEFYFETTENIDKNKHKIVKNYLAFTDSLLKIEHNDGYLLKLSSGDIINTNPYHSFAIYDRELNKFTMCKAIDINIDNHLIVNTFKL